MNRMDSVRTGVARGPVATAAEGQSVDESTAWRPYEDKPLLTPEMVLGLNEADEESQGRLIRYLDAVVQARTGPVHVNVAFNAAYFGYDTGRRGYVGGAIESLDSLPTVGAGGGGGAAVPVGALVKLGVGQHDIFAEVVYKEGAHPELGDDGSLPAWLSGAPSGAVGPGETNADPHPVLRERLVIDVDAFGHGLSVTDTQLARLSRQGRVLDEFGHVVINARYDSREEADLDESSFYARYLLSQGRDLLLSSLAPMPLGAVLTRDAGAEQYEAALLGLFGTVEEALRRSANLRIWRGYAFTRAGFAARLRDNGPLGGPDLETIATQLRRGALPERPSRWQPRRRVLHTAIGPRLRDVRGAAELLRNTYYPLAVCHVNSVVSDYVRGESDELTGLLEDEVSLRLDDAWQGGGVWRAEYPGSVDARLDPTQPLGRGWSETLTERVPEATEVPETDLAVEFELDAERDDWGLGPLLVTDSQLSWSQPLRLSHQVEGVLPIPEHVAAKMRGAVPKLRVMLTHAGYELPRGAQQQDTQTELYGPRPLLRGIEWPLEFFPGIVLTCTWARGAGVVHVESTLLDVPITVDDMEIEHRYDPGILTRDTAPGSGQRSTGGPGSSTMPTDANTLSQRVLSTVRRLGLLDPDGRAVLPRVNLARAIYGVPNAAQVRDVDETALDDVVDRLVAGAALRTDAASYDPAARRLRFPPVPGERTVEVLVYEPVIVTGVTGRQRSAGRQRLDAKFVRESEVAGHLRRIGHRGHAASDDQRRAYRRDRERFGLVGPVELPDGYTYIAPFTRRT
ncbi:hypothetical protein IOD16_18120 [Saccharothrix sp. 6-C]|uniref:hypothetical protein n=1 Tax=Saccharothrix sp. 6-C TaxID=2781735 RepID=UPI0019170385|nr:hypothetical protein [Saccharothrix sp. 6-C]QQQ80128.1 hypothetical protein IOD16_18120 [Saccharothrix sp. 6-C]